MRLKSPNIIYLLFFLSGVAGLIYEIVWSRLLVLIFGSTTNSIVAVIAAFLGGLAIGSLVFGHKADSLSPKQLIRTYSILELGVGIGAALTIILIPLIKILYAPLSDGTNITPALLIVKFGLSIFVLIMPTFLMGATLPILARFVQSQNKTVAKGVSLLYAANTFGAVTGVLLAAFILIELFGLTRTLLIATTINVCVALVAYFISTDKKIKNIKSATYINSSYANVISTKTVLIIAAFSLSGLIAIAYEILWARILTPTLGTFIYAFSAVLAIYLFGIAFGSFLYDKFSKFTRAKSLTFAICQLGIGFFALFSVYLTSNQIVIDKNLMVLLVLFPATIFMGLTFPAVVAMLGHGNNSGKIIGLSYFANTVGSIIGGFLASFFFLRLIGSTQSIILLSLVNFVIAAVFIKQEAKISPKTKLVVALPVLFLIIFTSWLFTFKRHSLYESLTQWRINWAKANDIDFILKEDEVASTFGYHNRKNNDQNLFIDGVPTTGRVGETKLMAHIPILLHPNPSDVLVIAFGMGSTYRSALSWDLKTDAVELVPSVPEMMTLFHPDAKEVLTNPLGRIITNDGRNYVFLTEKKYDIVTIDPPPPFNAAGTTVLYSKNFYQEVAQKLKPQGIVSQWLWFGSREDDISMAAKSFTEVFPYVLAFKTPQGAGGLFLEGSATPINLGRFDQKLSNPKPELDLAELYEEFKLAQIPSLLIADREDLLKLIEGYGPVTDDKPKTEYFILRHLFKKSPDLTEDGGRNFIKSLEEISASNSSKVPY